MAAGRNGSGAYFLALLLLDSNLLIEGSHHPLVCLGPEHLIRLPPRNKVRTLHTCMSNSTHTIST